MSKKEVSSGTEKAETLTRTKSATKSSTTKKSQPIKDSTKGSSVNKSTGKTQRKSQKQSNDSTMKAVSDKSTQRKEAREQRKLEAAKIRAEKKQRRLEKRLEAKQKRLDRIAAFKQARAERREARRERHDMLRHETKEARIERKQAEKEARIEARVAKREAAVAERQAKREHRLKVRAEKRAARNEKRHAPGFGGWLAAVISLGVVTLALGTMLTFGWLYMGGMQADMASIHTESLYELNSIVDNLDTNLSKARVANTKNEQIILLNDIAVESEMAETILERFPMDMQLTQKMTSFVNKMGDSAQSMLRSVANGRKLTESQIASLQYMYETNQQLKQTLNDLCSTAGQKDILEMLRGNTEGLMYVTFGEIENTPVEVPQEIHDGPFAENTESVSAKNLAGLEEITAARAEELAQGYFKDYDVTGVSCTGEVMSDKLQCYNVTVSTNDGDMWAQLSKFGGKVVEFNSYKDCSDKNFSVERCIAIAEDFLSDLGFEDMKAVWTSENGSTCNLNFAYVEDGVIVYADMVKVKVCEQRGIVTGMEALSYVLNHTDRDIASAGISKSEAKEKLNTNLEVKTSRLALIPTDGGERLAWEFYGVYGGNDYYVYVDAQSGQEIEMFTVVGTAQGRALM